jgi:hypothetical protein
MFFAKAGADGRRDLKLAGNEFPENVGVFVINMSDFFLASRAGHELSAS